MSDLPTLAVRQRDGVREYEQHIRSIRPGDTALGLPRSISHAGGLGRSISLAQMIATWADTTSQRQVRTTLTSDRSDEHQRFVSRLHGLAAAYFANAIMAADGETNLKRPLLAAATPRIVAMANRDFLGTARGRLAELVFVHGARHQFHSAAYQREPHEADLKDPQLHGNLIVSPREMNALISNVLAALNLPRRDFTRIAPLLDNSLLPLGHLLHEAFRNTAEHAYLDIQGRLPPRGLRCILIATHHARPAELEATALVSATHPEVDAYFRQLRARASRRQRELVFVLELSVLDTGPGFAETIGVPTLSDASDDPDRVIHCFRDHVSSKPGPNSGLGLGRILAHVRSLDGFLRIRTSTTEAFFSSLTPESNCHPLPHVAGGLPKATGTALTISVPLEL